MTYTDGGGQVQLCEAPRLRSGLDTLTHRRAAVLRSRVGRYLTFRMAWTIDN
jgi:hypothetical protein